jgi:hypothetical protein
MRSTYHRGVRASRRSITFACAVKVVQDNLPPILLSVYIFLQLPFSYSINDTLPVAAGPRKRHIYPGVQNSSPHLLRDLPISINLHQQPSPTMFSQMLRCNKIAKITSTHVQELGYNTLNLDAPLKSISYSLIAFMYCGLRITSSAVSLPRSLGPAGAAGLPASMASLPAGTLSPQSVVANHRPLFWKGGTPPCVQPCPDSFILGS